MEKIVIYRRDIISRDWRLGRNVNHDSRSRNFAFNTEGLTLSNVTHNRHIPILEQGQVGSCTGNAGIGGISTDPIFLSLSKNAKYTLNEKGAIELYSDAETIDGDGPYPPNDNGSSGLSIAKALKNAGIISSYQHIFTLNNTLLALTKYPILVGINWYEGMFNCDADGRVRISGDLSGGHEIVARQIDVTNSKIWFDNSWGTSWGIGGRFYLTFTDLGTLLSQQGDVIVPIPISTVTTTTTPKPLSPEDAALYNAFNIWMKAKGH